MVAREDDHRAVGHSGLLERLQHLADLVVDRRHQVVVVGQVAAHDGRVRMIGRNAEPGRVVAFAGRERGQVPRHLGSRCANLALVRGLDVEEPEERPVAGNGARPVGHDVKRPGRHREIEVGLAVGGPRRPADRVAGLSQKLREHRRRLQQGRPHVVRADARGIAPGDQPRAAGGADRGVREGPGEPHALASQPVQIRRDRVRVAVAAQLGAHVLAHDPDHVRPVVDRAFRAGQSHNDQAQAQPGGDQTSGGVSLGKPGSRFGTRRSPEAMITPRLPRKSRNMTEAPRAVLATRRRYRESVHCSISRDCDKLLHASPFRVVTNWCTCAGPGPRKKPRTAKSDR